VREDLAVLLSERFERTRPGPAAAGEPSAGGRGPRRLPVSTTSLIGREQAVAEVAGLVEQPGARLVTLTGPGGVGKTRLAVAAAGRLRDRFAAGTAFVPLAAVTDPGLVLAAVGRAADADLAGTGAPVPALAEAFGDGAWLLVLDNLEQVVQVAPDLAELLARCPGLAMLVTSRTVLGLRAEREYPVPPLELPGGPGAASVAEMVAASPAVELFVDRARAVRPGFALTEGNAVAVAEICRRLEGLPLAIELAAARIRLLDPPALLGRLAASLDALGAGAVDLPERQRTLRATVEWSVGLLEDAERSLLEVAAVFADGWTVPAASAVAGLAEDRALELSEALARHSLIYLDNTGLGSRTRMLETVRAFVAERLAARPDASQVGRRHAGYYRDLAEQADRPLRRTGRGEWLERLDAEAGGGGDFGQHRGRHVGAGGPPAPGAAAGRDLRSLPARGIKAGPGVDLADHRRLRRGTAGGDDRAGGTPRPGRARLHGHRRVHRRLPGHGAGPLRRRPGPPARVARPDGAGRRRLAHRGFPGGAGHPGCPAGQAR
jgi:predicted ATPase